MGKSNDPESRRSHDGAETQARYSGWGQHLIIIPSLVSDMLRAIRFFPSRYVSQ